MSVGRSRQSDSFARAISSSEWPRSSLASRFRALGLKPAELLDPHAARRIDPVTLAQVRQTISAGLLWVFVAMVVLGVALLAVTTLLPSRKADPDQAAPGIEPVPA